MPTLNPWIILGFVATVIGAYFTGGFVESGRCDTRWELKTEKDKKDAVELALTTERANQEKANAAIRKQAADQAAINARLRADLAGLRNRPERPADLSTNARPACSGATGAELSRSDAGFLVGEAARADEVRAGLSACYQVIDGIQPR
jgi:hypothetical protein